MKKLIIIQLIALAYSISVKAQPLYIEVTDSSNMDLTLSEYLDSLFGAVNSTDITTGYLMEASGLNIDTEKWDGIDSNGFDTLNNRFTWFYHLGAMYAAHKAGTQHFEDPEATWHIADSLTWNDTIAIMVLSAKYNTLRLARVCDACPIPIDITKI